jgi:hypothetical protein
MALSLHPSQEASHPFQIKDFIIVLSEAEGTAYFGRSGAVLYVDR